MGRLFRYSRLRQKLFYDGKRYLLRKNLPADISDNGSININRSPRSSVLYPFSVPLISAAAAEYRRTCLLLKGDMHRHRYDRQPTPMSALHLSC